MRTIETGRSFRRDLKREKKGRHGARLDALLTPVLDLLATDTPCDALFSATGQRSLWLPLTKQKYACVQGSEGVGWGWLRWGPAVASIAPCERTGRKMFALGQKGTKGPRLLADGYSAFRSLRRKLSAIK